MLRVQLHVNDNFLSLFAIAFCALVIFIFTLLGRRKRLSEEFYGRCVSQFVTISTPVKYITDPDIMVFVTYPMMEHAGDSFCISCFLYHHTSGFFSLLVR